MQIKSFLLLFDEVLHLNMKILLLNGPNINLIGTREPMIYGSKSFDEFFVKLKNDFPDLQLEHFQSNIEGELINKIHEASSVFDFIIINAGAYTHTSIAIADALVAVQIPFVEVHISNILKREEYRHVSFIAPHALGIISGFGLESYTLALKYLISKPKL